MSSELPHCVCTTPEERERCQRFCEYLESDTADMGKPITGHPDQARAEEFARRSGWNGEGIVGRVEDSFGGYWQCAIRGAPFTFRLSETGVLGATSVLIVEDADQLAGQAGVTQGMSPLEMIAEWKRGCSIAGPRSKGIGIPDAEDKPELCPDCTVGLINAMQKHLETMLPHVRAVRRWHWQQLVECRAKHMAWGEGASAYGALADHHLKCVQSLNDFFPVGDTAENDLAKETK